MKQSTILFTAIIFLFSACANHAKKEQLKHIKQAEEELYKAENFNRENGIKLVDLYINFTNTYPDDSEAPKYLYKAAEITMNLQMGQQSINYFDQLLVKYPNYEKIPECIFLKAFVYENQLNNITKAEELYKEFIDKYPDHALVKDAEASIRFLGKSPEELVKIFQEMNKE